MKFHSPSSVLGALLALVAALFLVSCGGGGAQGNPDITGAVTIQPATGTLYAGIPYTFQVQGGRTPYSINSSEQGLLPVPSQISGHSFTVVGNNPGVIDPGLQATDLPRRTVNISVRSGDGQTALSTVTVGQNFLTGYGIRFTPVTCPLSGATGNEQACAGGESTIQMSATFNGNLGGDRQFQFQNLKGHYQFEFPQGGVAGNTVTTVSDHSGNITVIFKVDNNAPTEVAVVRVIDVATGVYDDHAFVITGVTGNSTNPLTVIPSTITFTGVQTTDCGGGAGSFLVFGGTPPYTAISTVPRASLRNTTSSTTPGQFTFDMSASGLPCQFGPIVVTDATGQNVQLQVQAQPGTATPPTPAAFTVAPTSITLGCGQSGSVSVVGGSGSYSTASSSTGLTAVVSGNTVTITRLNASNSAGTDTISITDGANIGTVTVTDPNTCP